MCQEYLADFESSFVQITAVNVRLERRIEQTTRNDESVSVPLDESQNLYGL